MACYNTSLLVRERDTGWYSEELCSSSHLQSAFWQQYHRIVGQGSANIALRAASPWKQMALGNTIHLSSSEKGKDEKIEHWYFGEVEVHVVSKTRFKSVIVLSIIGWGLQSMFPNILDLLL